MNSKEIIKLNFELQNKLSPENKKYYDRILMYIRANIKKDTQLTEETLYEVLQHILAGQEEGKKASDVFGEDPTIIAKDILEQLPEEPNKSQLFYWVEIFCVLFGVYIAVQAIPFLFKGISMPIYLGSLVVKTLAILIGFSLILFVYFKMIRSTGEKGLDINWKWGLLFGAIFAGSSLGIGLLTVFLDPFGPSFNVPNYIPAVLGVMLVGLSIIISKIRK